MACNLTHTRGQQRRKIKYLYNGKEKQEALGIDWLDYDARMCMLEIGRWSVAAPLAEKYFKISPYVYAAKMPVILIDPNGMELDYSDLTK